MSSYLIVAITFAGIFVIAGSGLYVLTGLTGQISLAQGAYVLLERHLKQLEHSEVGDLSFPSHLQYQ